VAEAEVRAVRLTRAVDDAAVLRLRVAVGAVGWGVGDANPTCRVTDSLAAGTARIAVRVGAARRAVEDDRRVHADVRARIADVGGAGIVVVALRVRGAAAGHRRLHAAARDRVTVIVDAGIAAGPTRERRPGHARPGLTGRGIARVAARLRLAVGGVGG